MLVLFKYVEQEPRNLRNVINKVTYILFSLVEITVANE